MLEQLFRVTPTFIIEPKKSSPNVEDDTFTQFSYACSRLGIDLKLSSVPQAKGRVERLFQTLQSRLLVELRLAGATSIEQANAFLNSYIKEYNAKFALPSHHIKSAFEAQPSLEELNRILCVLTPRKVDAGHCLRFRKQYLRLLDDQGCPVFYRKGTQALVIEAFDGSLFASVDERIYFLEAVPEHVVCSKVLDPAPVQKPKHRPQIPSLDHPWRFSSFLAHLESRAPSLAL